MDPTLTYVLYAVIVLVVLILAYYFLYPTSYTLYVNQLPTSIGGICVTNDSMARTFKSSGLMDGIFYETTPYAATNQYALLVVPGKATDYYTNMSAVQKLVNIVPATATPNVTSDSVPTYLGVIVSATNGVVDKDITATKASSSTWLGVCDLTVLLANFVASGKLITSIGTFTGTLPTVNGTAVSTSAIAATSTTGWPMMPTSASSNAVPIAGLSGVSGNGLAISCNKCFSTVYDSIYLHKGVATTAVQPTPPTK